MFKEKYMLKTRLSDSDVEGIHEDQSPDFLPPSKKGSAPQGLWWGPAQTSLSSCGIVTQGLGSTHSLLWVLPQREDSVPWLRCWYTLRHSLTPVTGQSMDVNPGPSTAGQDSLECPSHSGAPRAAGWATCWDHSASLPQWTDSEVSP